MSAADIVTVHARQILDSRGRPTVEAEVVLADGSLGRAATPSGASTGRAEAVEMRDRGTAWGGLGVSCAIANVTDRIAPAVAGMNVFNQAALDRRMRELDGSPNLAVLGANATLAVSLAAVRAAANCRGQPLFERFAELIGSPPSMPMPMVNILSGGMHAGRGMDIQDFLVVPCGASSFGEALAWVCRIRDAAAELCSERGITTLLADEGGLSPGFARSEEALDLMLAAFDRAGLRAGDEVAITLDLAASSLVTVDGSYAFARLGQTLAPSELIDLQASWAARYPIISIEDGLGEEDWSNWLKLTQRLDGIQLVGDDLFATQPDRIERGIAAGVANAVLVKVNQNGTVSGTIDALLTARSAGYATVISARSGETEDDFLADLAVGSGAGQIKIGSVRNSERLAKYNQLLRIQEKALPWSGMSGFAPL